MKDSVIFHADQKWPSFALKEGRREHYLHTDTESLQMREAGDPLVVNHGRLNYQ
jgi:hypothetical protein